MNKKLTEQIAHHILANFGVLPASFIDWQHTQSLADKQYVMSDKLVFENEDSETIKNSIYACQVTAPGSKELKIVLGDCTEDGGTPEYCLIVHLKDSPTYGVYLFYDHSESEAMIAVNIDNKGWMPCETYLQATFLAGMERIKDLFLTWNKCTEYKEEHQSLLSFIKFHDSFYEESNEGQKSRS
jgi:hypothetical protein